MKTHTEMFGLQLREIYRWRWELIQAHRQEKRNAPRTAPAAVVTQTVETPPVEAPLVEPPTEEAPAPSVESTEPETHVDTLIESEVQAAPEAPVEKPVEPVAVPVPAAAPPPLPADHIKNADERLAELALRKAAEEERRQKAWKASVEEIREPLTAKIKEKYDWSDERIQIAVAALDLIDRKRVEDLRRIVVLKSEKEGEPAPRVGTKIGELVFVTEYFPPKFVPAPEERPGRRRDGKKGRGKGGPRDGKGRRGPGGPREGSAPSPFGDRNFKGPRPQGAGGKPGGPRPPKPFGKSRPVVERKGALKKEPGGR